jgi:transcriptional regulator with XRE-family HTH domain
MAHTKNFADVIRKKLSADQDLAAGVEREYFNANIASQIYDLRKSHGLTQQQLAERIGTHQSVIARLEDADYEGHSLAMLTKIASALNRRLSVSFQPPLVSPETSGQYASSSESTTGDLLDLGIEVSVTFPIAKYRVASKASKSAELEAAQ